MLDKMKDRFDQGLTKRKQGYIVVLGCEMRKL